MRLTLAALLLLSSAAFAHADTFQTFNLAGTLVSGSVSGTLTLNQTTGQFSSESSLFVTSSDGVVSFNEAQTTTGFTNNFSYAAFQNGGYTAYIEINVPSLVGYTGGALCTTSAQCPGGNSSVILLASNDGNFISGSLTAVPVAPLAGTPGVAPEPSSLVLLGTGMLGFAGAARRKFFKA